MAIDPRKLVGENSQLNMTPMIDIVFQLILFFLFSLKFKSLDWRIESEMPRGYGVDVVPRVVEEPPHMRATLVRIGAEDLARARTKVRMAGHEWILPPESPATQVERDRILADLSARMVTLRSATAGLGEIDTPPPTGALVPHGDVMSVLDAFLIAKVDNIEFRGAAPPMPRRR